ncbi:uncharacterized protein PV07_11798 [Cladophialophora immunda]|uniref:Fe2OG dioxygenase domain-containing protein n=1 Tax=Cladophialophora immunda TaxID=569365 RepID=A0A0D1Z7L7_9EURO|nr:uncharacterized protein PV07_11798 [Cladophialophora immunda]KIW23611.1 hypothetical protein PV07_11798 [Cladophialophora immunda]
MASTIVDTIIGQEPEYVYFHYDGKYGHRREVLKDGKLKTTFTDIPLIDIAGLFSDNLTDQVKVADEIRKACEEVGFFYIKNHGVEQELIDDTVEVMKDYFRQPTEKKMDQWIYKNTNLQGYEPIFGARLDDTKSRGDRKESFLLTYDPELDPVPPQLTALQRALLVENNFPADQPDFKDQLVSYHSRLIRLSRVLVQAFALALGLEKTALDGLFSSPHSTMKIIHYPPQEPESQDETGIGAHTDFDTFTILWQDTVGGLEVLNANAHWVPAHPIPGTFVVNVGDFLMRMSNGRFVSTVHRVSNTTGHERYSLPFFFSSNHYATVEPLSACLTPENPPQYEPLTVYEYYQKRQKQQRERFLNRGFLDK